ncbi:MAG: hypothetical protein BGO03_01215 [Mesorhizobium sp. 61-13]|nr:MAG: hypothetical protein BGO03_01215 [Mesorhizobium sp. 61-13]
MISAFNAEDQRPRDDFADYYRDMPVISGLPTASSEIPNGALLGGIRAKLTFSPQDLSSFGVWTAFQSGLYAFALEPALRFDQDCYSPDQSP